MRNNLRLLPVLILLNLQLQAQCDAAFTDTVYPNSGEVSFTSLTTVQHVQHTWLFGDGTSAFAANPAHNYTQPGQYSVLHMVMDSLHTCIDTVRKTITVNFAVTPTKCDGGFTDTVHQNSVSFTSLAAARNVRHTWLFGDGTSSAYSNPVHIYSQPGQYNVLHTVMDSLHTCVDSVSKIIVVNFTTPPAQCNAGFTDSVYQNQVIFRSIVTASHIKHTWLFGDGTSSADISPVHNYGQPGQYSVLHLVSDSLHGCVDSVRKIINIGSFACQVKYTVQHPSLSNQYYFNLQYSTNGSALQSVDWKINGVHISSQQSLSYTFPQPGRYNVCVSIQALSGCTAQYCDSISVQLYNNCKNLISFTAVPNTAQAKTIEFTASPDQPQIRYSWSFGDGYSAGGRKVSHTYIRSGIYNVNLLAVDSISHCYDSVSKAVKIEGAPSETCTVSFTHTTDQQGLVHFTATSNQPIVSQSWTILHMPDTLHTVTITTPNPVYAFKDSGYYIVCLAIRTSTGCRTSVCDSLLIKSVTGRRAAGIPSYPNPVSSSETSVKLNIEMEEQGLVQLKVCDLSGTIVYQSQRPGFKGVNNIAIPIQQLGKGQYFIDISYGSQQTRSRFNKL